jgi:hypothetical protein
MKCIVTGAETNNKWKGHPICKEVIDLAKSLEGENGFLDTTLRERIIMIRQQWRKRVAEEADAKVKTKEVKPGLMAKIRELFNGQRV